MADLNSLFKDAIADAPGAKSSDWGNFGEQKIAGEPSKAEGSMGEVQYADVNGSSQSPKFMTIAGSGGAGGGMGESK